MRGSDMHAEFWPRRERARQLPLRRLSLFARLYHSSLAIPPKGHRTHDIDCIRLLVRIGQRWPITESIVAQRYTGKRTQYLVRWKGYAAEENTWEPLSSLSNAPDAFSDWIVRRSA